MGLYVEDYNRFLTYSTPNQFAMNFLNPFHPMVTMAVTIEFPLLPNPTDESVWDDIPIFTLNDFIGYCQPFEQLIRDENDFLYNAFVLYRALAINNIQYGNVKDEVNWRFLVANYIGHYMTLHVEDLKDPNLRYSLNESPVEKTYKVEDIQFISKNEFYATPYGIRFWDKYSVIGRWVWKGYRTKRGRY